MAIHYRCYRRYYHDTLYYAPYYLITWRRAKEAVKAVLSIANGNLNTPIKTNFKESMLASVAQMQEKLRAIVIEVMKSSDELNARANEVAKVSEESKTSSYHQAQSSEESVGHIKEIVEAVNGVSNIAKQTEENSGYTTELSTKGREAMQITIAEIEKLHKPLLYQQSISAC